MGVWALPAVLSIVLSMVSPVVIKLTLADPGRTGGVVGTVYAFSTAGSILGTFLTGVYFPAVTQVSHRYLGPPYGTTIKTYNIHARLFLIEGISQQKYDIVIGDVFNDYATPYHLTTLEFGQALKEVMKPDGVYLLNSLSR